MELFRGLFLCALGIKSPLLHKSRTFALLDEIAHGGCIDANLTNAVGIVTMSARRGEWSWR